MKSIETVRVDLQYSRVGVGLLAAMAIGTLAVTFATPVALPLRLALMAAVVAVALEALHRVVLLRGPRAVRRLRVQRDGAIVVECPSGARTSGELKAGSFVAPWLVIVRWRPLGGRRDATVLLLPDMADAQALRRLRVLLRWA
jgi:toxin CptA